MYLTSRLKFFTNLNVTYLSFSDCYVNLRDSRIFRENSYFSRYSAYYVVAMSNARRMILRVACKIPYNYIILIISTYYRSCLWVQRINRWAVGRRRLERHWATANNHEVCKYIIEIYYFRMNGLEEISTNIWSWNWHLKLITVINHEH